MPIFDYVCLTCGATKKDKLVKHYDDEIVCDCGDDMNRQVCATSNLLLMGDGFYKSHDRDAAKVEKKWI